MKLITEISEDIQVDVIEEAAENGGKDLYISGVFMETGKKNRNGRVYPRAIMEREVHRYSTESISRKRSLGELEHPSGPKINLDRVSHMITELNFVGEDVYGKAKVLTDLPCGKIVEGLIRSGVQLGVSSRGLGSLKQNRQGIMEVQEDFKLATVDIVADPSAPGAWVDGIMESKEWVFIDGHFVEKDIALVKEAVKNATKSQLDEGLLVSEFEKFLAKISR